MPSAALPLAPYPRAVRRQDGPGFRLTADAAGLAHGIRTLVQLLDPDGDFFPVHTVTGSSITPRR